jgi:hypothetical protein
MPVLLDACSSSHSDLRQCAVYGVGLGASLAAELFKPHAAAALAAVQAIVTAPVSGILLGGGVGGVQHRQANAWQGLLVVGVQVACCVLHVGCAGRTDCQPLCRSGAECISGSSVRVPP